jgi:hypothetical protein
MAEIRLEGFEGIGALRKHRALVFGKPEDWLRYIRVLEADTLYKGKTVLVCTGMTRGLRIPRGLGRKVWDVLFCPKDTFDYQMILTYVENAPKPVRVVWVSMAGEDIPKSLWTRWSGKDITVVGCCETLGGMMGCEWEAIFFPIACPSEAIERVVSKRGSGIRQLLLTLTATTGALNDIYEKGAALMWSGIEESDSRGALYWYDPQEGTQESPLSKGDAMDLIEELKGYIGKS